MEWMTFIPLCVLTIGPLIYVGVLFFIYKMNMEVAQIIESANDSSDDQEIEALTEVHKEDGDNTTNVPNVRRKKMMTRY